MKPNWQSTLIEAFVLLALAWAFLACAAHMTWLALWDTEKH